MQVIYKNLLKGWGLLAISISFLLFGFSQLVYANSNNEEIIILEDADLVEKLVSNYDESSPYNSEESIISDDNCNIISDSMSIDSSVQMHISDLNTLDLNNNVAFDCDSIYEDIKNTYMEKDIDNIDNNDAEIINILNNYFNNIVQEEYSIVAKYNRRHSWHDFANNYIYEQLTTKEKIIWRSLDIVCNEAIATNTDYQYSLLPYIKTSYFNCTNDISNFLLLFKYCNPQYYFIKNEFCCYGDCFALGIYNNFSSGDDRKVYTRKFEKNIYQYINKINADTEYDLMKAINGILCHNIDYTYKGMKDEENNYTQSAYSAFVLRKTVCTGYTLAAEALCNYFDIDCLGVTSDNHAWNKIIIDDNWYNLDVTWNDSNSIDNKISKKFFLVSDKRISKYDSDEESHEIEPIWKSYIQKSRFSYSDISE